MIPEIENLKKDLLDEIQEYFELHKGRVVPKVVSHKFEIINNVAEHLRLAGYIDGFKDAVQLYNSYMIEGHVLVEDIKEHYKKRYGGKDEKNPDTKNDVA